MGGNKNHSGTYQSSMEGHGSLGKAQVQKLLPKFLGGLHGNFARKGLPKQRAEATPSKEDIVNSL
jgi:hypothetical protein